MDEMILQVRHLSKLASNEVLRDIDFTVNRGM